MRKKLFLAAASVVVLIAAAFLLLFRHADRFVTRTFDVPFPAIRAASDPESLARGERIFVQVCADCHVDPETGRASGRPMPEVPAFLGKIHTANLTKHYQNGIGTWRDEELARALRAGVRRDGTVLRMPMPRYGGMADADVAAVIGFLRSDHPFFVHDEKASPRPALSRAGRLIQTMNLPPDPAAAAVRIEAPPPGPTVDYGRYRVEEVYHCGECHTAGFKPAKVRGPDAYGGGFELALPSGPSIFSTNITFSEQGLKGYTLEQFARAMREGVDREGRLVRPPMPRWRRIDDVEMAAIYAYLTGVAPSAKANRIGEAGPREPGPAPDAKPEELFAKLGCTTCHARGAPFRDKIRASVGKPVEEVAAWIRNPERTRPDTQMPTFESLLDETQAKALAAWVQEEAERQ